MEGYFILGILIIFFIFIILGGIISTGVYKNLNELKKYIHKTNIDHERTLQAIKDRLLNCEEQHEWCTLKVHEIEGSLKHIYHRSQQWKDTKKVEPNNLETVLVLVEGNPIEKKCIWYASSQTFVPVEKNAYPSIYQKNTVTHWLRIS